MPEYLAPGVYVEEVPSGNKPIEGVSTSTVGVVGVTQRGPINTPTLVTSFGDFTRKFGGYLDHNTFTDDRDALPYAVEGFFTNGGKRMYVSRIIGTGAIHATATINSDDVPSMGLMTIHARYPGSWGDRLRVSTSPANILETTVAEDADTGSTSITLNAAFGLSAGSVLEIGSTTIKVSSIDQNVVRLVDPLTSAITADAEVKSLEFDLIIEHLNEDDKVTESEFFPNLGLDPNHNRYAPDIVGPFDVNNDMAGESELIRLSDLIPTDDPDDLRLSAVSEDVNTLEDGDDGLAGIDSNTYIGTPAIDPQERTGIFSLENIDDISIVGVPGRTEQDVQNAIINHCTKMRYRFGVLDAEKDAMLDQVQKQRQLYDTTYAALYHPWLVIGDRFGRNGDVHHIPVSGHVMGIYARTDNRRGVHKAPANEVVLGVRDLQVRLNQGEQDILNPRHINALRDFRDINRGLRVWGARTLSSDPEWKYVNVRRLFLFIEKSIENGTQFAVFEPNSEPLWATIRRSVSNFLTAVWRSGALEGTTVEEAFFVKVDRETMTQNDIDNGRLIVLVGIAPVKPAEFVIFRISQKTREATA